MNRYRMKAGAITGLLVIFGILTVAGQTCTLTTTTNPLDWNNATMYACQEGGTRNGKSVLVIPAGLTVDFDSNGDTWTGNWIIVYGKLIISQASGITLNSSIEVKNGGTLQLDSKLDLGTSNASCSYQVQVETGGKVTIPGNASDRLTICGTNVAQGGGGCKPYPGAELPYCAPPGGFTGPTGFDRDGLPVSWLSFIVRDIDNKSAFIAWSTASELNAHSFVVERSADGFEYSAIATVPATGTTNVRQDYSYIDSHPLIGRNYYRLRQIDMDGSYEFSDTRFVDLTGGKMVSVYPNPVQENEMNVRLNFSEDQEVRAWVVDVTGLEVYRFNFAGTHFKGAIHLQPGTYLLNAQAGNDFFVCRFVVN